MGDIEVRFRAGDLPTPTDGTWTDPSLSDGQSNSLSNQEGRYGQYEITLNTDSDSLTPKLRGISVAGFGYSDAYPNVQNSAGFGFSQLNSFSGPALLGSVRYQIAKATPSVYSDWYYWDGDSWETSESSDAATIYSTYSNTPADISSNISTFFEHPNDDGGTFYWRAFLEPASGSIGAEIDTIDVGFYGKLTGPDNGRPNVEPASLSAGDTGNVAVSLTLQQALPITGKIKVTFPDEFTLIGPFTIIFEDIADGTITSSSVGYTVTLTRSGASGEIAAGTTIKLTFANIKNPTGSGFTDEYQIKTTTSANAIIDQDLLVTADSIEAGVLSSCSVTPQEVSDNVIAGYDGYIDIAFTTANILPGDGKIVIDLPATMNADGAGITNVTGMTSSSYIVTPSDEDSDGNNERITVDRVGGSNTAAGTNVSFRLTSIRNMQYVDTTGTFSLKTQNNSGNTIDHNVSVSGFDVDTPGTLANTSVTLSGSSNVVDTNSYITCAFQTYNPIPDNAKIKVMFPVGFDASGSASGSFTGGTRGTVAVTNGIDGGTGRHYVIITRQGNGSVIAADTSVADLQINNVTTPGSVNPGGTGNYAFYTYLNDGATAIDRDALVQPNTLVAGAFNSADLDFSNLGSSATGNVDLVLTLGHTLPGDSMIEVTFGNFSGNYAFDFSSVDINQQGEGGTSINGTFTIDASSAPTLVITRAGGADTSGSSAVVIRITGVTNPAVSDSVSTGNAAVITKDSSGYVIDTGSAGSDNILVSGITFQAGYPDSGDDWIVGNAATIKGYAVGTSGEIELVYSTTGSGGPWINWVVGVDDALIVGGAPDYVFTTQAKGDPTIPDAISNNVIIRARDRADPNNSDIYKDILVDIAANLTMAAPLSLPWTVGNTNKNLTCNVVTGTVSNIKFQYMSDHVGWTNINGTDAASTAAVGGADADITWGSIPADAIGHNVQVRGIDADPSRTGGAQAIDVGDIFDVKGIISNITISSDSSSDIWYSNRPGTISWNDTGTINNVTIEYRTENDAADDWHTVISGYDCSGSSSYSSWTAPAVLMTADGHDPQSESGRTVGITLRIIDATSGHTGDSIVTTTSTANFFEVKYYKIYWLVQSASGTPLDALTIAEIGGNTAYAAWAETPGTLTSVGELYHYYPYGTDWASTWSRSEFDTTRYPTVGTWAPSEGLTNTVNMREEGATYTVIMETNYSEAADAVTITSWLNYKDELLAASYYTGDNDEFSLIIEDSNGDAVTGSPFVVDKDEIDSTTGTFTATWDPDAGIARDAVYVFQGTVTVGGTSILGVSTFSVPAVGSYELVIDPIYDSASDAIKATVWLSRSGEAVTDPDDLTVFDVLDDSGASLLAGEVLTQASADANSGIYSVTWDPAAGTSASEIYNIIATVEYRGNAYSGVKAISPPTASITFEVFIDPIYNSADDSIKASIWLSRSGEVVTDPGNLSAFDVVDINGNSLLAGANLTKTSSQDNAGIYTVIWDPAAGLTSGVVYNIKATIVYGSDNYSSVEAFSVTTEKGIGLAQTAAAAASTAAGLAKTAAEATESRLGAATDTASATSVFGKIAAVRGDVSTITTTVEEQLLGEMLTRQNIAKTGDTVTIRYKTTTGLVPTIVVRDPDNAIVVSSTVMTEVDTTGIYEYDVTFDSDWGTGEFSIVCSETTKGTLGAMTMTVISTDLAEIASSVSAISGQTAKLAKISSITASLSSQISLIEGVLNKVSTDIVGKVKSAVENMSNMDVVFERLEAINKQIKEAAKDRDLNLEEILKSSKERKNNIIELMNTTQKTKAAIEILEKAESTSGAFTQEIYQYK